LVTTVVQQVVLLSSHSFVATIFVIIAFNLSSKVNALSMSVFLSMDVCAMVASIYGAHRDGDGGTNLLGATSQWATTSGLLL
jgi:hypothetical protein